MALASVLTLVKEELPFLNDGTLDSIINSRILQVQYFLQKYFSIADADVDDETKYTPLQNILVSKITAYGLLTRKAIELAGGNSSSSTGPQNTFLKKAQADVVDAEFDQIDIKKSLSLGQSSDQLLSNIQLEICTIAQTLNVLLPYCTGNLWDTYQPFIIIP